MTVYVDDAFVEGDWGREPPPGTSAFYRCGHCGRSPERSQTGHSDG